MTLIEKLVGQIIRKGRLTILLPDSKPLVFGPGGKPALTVRLATGATPRRAAVGWDSGRLAMILAVLEARCGLSFGSAEVYLNVAGGYRLTDPAADLAVAAALISALSERPVPSDCVIFGEIALSGEVRQVAHSALRLKESASLTSLRLASVSNTYAGR